MKRITNGKHKRNIATGPNKRPAFILKLWTMVNDPTNEAYIQWTPDGESFKVLSKENFEKVVLPKYFKHSNYSSFVRQLNMYGWHKVQDITSGAMQSGDEIRQFKSPYFIKGREDLLDSIVRNKSSKGSDDEDESDIGRILDEIDLIKSSQMEISSDLNRIKNDNQMLWRECYESRERHKAHAETFERILRFLASLYSNTQGKFVSDTLSPGQKQQRMILPNLSDLTNDDISELSSKNLPLSAIEQLFANNAAPDKFTTPSKSSRISTVSIEDPPIIGTHISDAVTPQSAETSPQSLWSDSLEDIKTPNIILGDDKSTASQFSLHDPLPNETDLYNSPNPSLVSSIKGTPAVATLSPTHYDSSTNPSSQKLSTNYNGTLAFPYSNMLSQSPLSSTDDVDRGLSLVPSTDPFSALPTTSAEPEPLPSLSADDIPIAPLVSDALFNTNQYLMQDNNTAQHLLDNSQDIESIIRNINFQGDSLQRIQDRIRKYTPQGESSSGIGSPPTDPTFDVDEFLMNSASDMLDGQSIDPSNVSTHSANFQDMGPPPQKRVKIKDEK